MSPEKETVADTFTGLPKGNFATPELNREKASVNVMLFVFAHVACAAVIGVSSVITAFTFVAGASGTAKSKQVENRRAFLFKCIPLFFDICKENNLNNGIYIMLFL